MASATWSADVSAELRAGEIVALLGPNGAGKSTLLDALAGALPSVQGRIERHGRVAIALQSPDLARRTVFQNVTLALAWWGVPRAERAERAREALRAIGADHLSRRRAATLSGGERRRVHLARTIAVRPDVLMLDEPFAGLDAEVRANLLEDALSALRSTTRATLVVVHDRAEAWALADRLLILLDGRLVASGSPRELLERPPSVAVARFLGFDGRLEDGDELVLTRPPHVALDPGGPLEARVTRAVPLEDGVRLELELDRRPSCTPSRRSRLRGSEIRCGCGSSVARGSRCRRRRAPWRPGRMQVTGLERAWSREVVHGREPPPIGEPPRHELVKRPLEWTAVVHVDHPPRDHRVGARRRPRVGWVDVHASEQLRLVLVEHRVVERLVGGDLGLVVSQVRTIGLVAHRRRRPPPRL